MNSIRKILEKIDYTRSNVSDDVLPLFSESSERSAGAQSTGRQGAFTLSSPVTLTGNYQPPQDVKFVTSVDGGCEVSYFGLFNDQSIFKKLKSLKKQALESKEKVFTSVHDILFEVLPHGTRGNVPASVILVGAGLRLEFRFQNVPEVPAIRVKMDYAFLRLASDIYNRFLFVRSVVCAFSFAIHREVISRLDINLTINRPFDDYANLFLSGCRAWRVRKFNVVANGTHFESISGGNHIQLTLYNKTRELQDKFSSDKVNDLRQYFTEEDMDKLTRIEFRLHRPFLHKIKIDSIEDYLEKELELVDYLTNDWFRLLVKKTDCKHADRIEIHDLWNLTRYCFLCAVPSHFRLGVRCNVPRFQKSRPSKILKKPQLKLSQGLGMAVSALSSLCPKIPSKRALKQALYRVIDEKISGLYESFGARVLLLDGLPGKVVPFAS